MLPVQSVNKTECHKAWGRLRGCRELSLALGSSQPRGAGKVER